MTVPQTETYLMSKLTTRAVRNGFLAIAMAHTLAACTAGYAPGYTAVEPYSSEPQTTPTPGSEPGTTGTPTPTPTASGSPAPTPTPSAAPGITWIGRTAPIAGQDANARSFAWAGVRFGVHFNGTMLDASLSDTFVSFEGHAGSAYFDVYVDGQLTNSFNASTTQATYHIASNLTPGEHTVWVSKRTEGMIGSAQFYSIDLGGGTLLSAPAKPPHRIEVLGASADVGYGSLATNCGGYVDSQESQDIAWPQLSADGLNAELSDLAFSGKGLVVNFDPINDPTQTEPVVFNMADYNIGATWDFTSWQPEVMLIDLGGNDMTGNGGTLPSNFVSSFVSFLGTVYQKYPNTMIYLVNNATETGDGRAQLTTALNQVVTQTKAAGHSKVAYFEFTLYTGNTFGCDGHPSAALHQQIAAEVIARVKTDLGW